LAQSAVQHTGERGSLSISPFPHFFELISSFECLFNRGLGFLRGIRVRLNQY